jgi:hypothetical protein
VVYCSISYQLPFGIPMKAQEEYQFLISLVSEDLKTYLQSTLNNSSSYTTLVRSSTTRLIVTLRTPLKVDRIKFHHVGSVLPLFQCAIPLRLRPFGRIGVEYIPDYFLSHPRKPLETLTLMDEVIPSTQSE